MSRKKKQYFFDPSKFELIEIDQLQAGDFMYLPEWAHFAPATMSSFGLSNGDTSRADNKRARVEAAFNAAVPRFMFFTDVSAHNTATNANSVRGKRVVDRVCFGVYPLASVAPERLFPFLAGGVPGRPYSIPADKTPALGDLVEQALERLVKDDASELNIICTGWDERRRPSTEREIGDSVLAMLLETDYRQPNVVPCEWVRKTEDLLPIASFGCYDPHIRNGQACQAVSEVLRNSRTYCCFDDAFKTPWNGVKLLKNLIRHGAVLLRSKAISEAVYTSVPGPAAANVIAKLGELKEYVKILEEAIPKAKARIEALRQLWTGVLSNAVASANAIAGAFPLPEEKQAKPTEAPNA